VGAEDAVNDVDVVDSADGVVHSAGMLGRVGVDAKSGPQVEQFVVGSRLLGEEGGQQIRGVNYEFDSSSRRFYKGKAPKML
jgi:hypothetical protein